MRLAASKPTSNGEPLRGDPVPSCSDELQTGVETCIQAHRMVPGPMCGVHAGAVPAELNGGVITELTDSSMVVTWDSPNLRETGEPKASYFPYGGGLHGQLPCSTDLILWNNGMPSQEGIDLAFSHVANDNGVELAA